MDSEETSPWDAGGSSCIERQKKETAIWKKKICRKRKHKKKGYKRKRREAYGKRNDERRKVQTDD